MLMAWCNSPIVGIYPISFCATWPDSVARSTTNHPTPFRFLRIPTFKYLSDPFSKTQPLPNCPLPSFPLFIFIPPSPLQRPTPQAKVRSQTHSYLASSSWFSNRQRFCPATQSSSNFLRCCSLFQPCLMACQEDITALGESLDRKLRLPGAKVGQTEVSNEAWDSVIANYKLSLAVKVLGKSLLSTKKTIELFKTVIWHRVSNLQLCFEGEDGAGSKYFLAKFNSESEMSNIVKHSPWTVGGPLVILVKFDPSCRVVDHSFNAASVWLQIHGLPPFAEKNREIILSLAKQAGTPEENSLVSHLEHTKIKVVLNPSQQLSAGSFLKRPNKCGIPIIFKYEKANLTCYRCAFLGHKEKSCCKPLIPGSSPSAFSFLEGFSASDFSSSLKPSTAKGKTVVSVDSQKVSRKESPIKSRNLLADLDAGVLGSGGKIEEVDKEQRIVPVLSPVKGMYDKVDSAHFKEKCRHSCCVNVQASVPSTDPPVEHLFHLLEGGQMGCGSVVNDNELYCDQTFIFKASENVLFHVTPRLIRKTKKCKGRGPMWQRVQVGTDSMRKVYSPAKSASSPAPEGSQATGSSTYDPSEHSSNSKTSSTQSKLLEWKGHFSNFTEEEEEYATSTPIITPELKGVVPPSVGSKRLTDSLSHPEVQVSQSLPVWKRPRLEPFHSA